MSAGKGTLPAFEGSEIGCCMAPESIMERIDASFCVEVFDHLWAEKGLPTCI